jgi:hypothetical protein
MFSHEAWATCDPSTVHQRLWANNEEEKREQRVAHSNWRHTVCRVGCEIALAEDDRFARVVTYGLTP